MSTNDFNHWVSRHPDLSGTLPADRDVDFALQVAREAWHAAETLLLNPEGRSVPEVIGIALLQGDHDQLGILADWLADQDRLDPILRDRLERLQKRHKVRFEQGFRWGPDQKPDYAVRDVYLPFPPFVGLYVGFDADDHHPHPLIESILWDVRTQTFFCLLTDDTTQWDTAEQAVAYYGSGWKLRGEDRLPIG
jgi:hypothetical protein